MPTVASGDAVDVFPPSAEIVTPYGASPRACESAALLSDGRVLYVGADGTSIIQGYAADLDTFFIDGSVVPTATAIFTGVSSPFACVFTPPQGGLYLACGWTVGGPTGSNGFIGVYRSPSGLGGDWVLHGTMQNYVWGDVTFGSRNNGSAQLGYPYFAPSGRWVISGPRWINGFTQRAYGMRQAVWTSDDVGATWVLRLDVGFYQTNGTNGYGQSRNITKHGGELHFSATGNVEGLKHFRSADEGLTWNQTDSQSGGLAPRRNYALSDGDAMYDFNEAGVVYRDAGSPQPDPTVNGTLFADYDLAGIAFATILQPLGDVWFASSYGQTLTPGSGDGWKVGWL